MRAPHRSMRLMVMALALSVMAMASCAPAEDAESARSGADRWSHQDWPTGHYRVVEDWPKPLPDDRHSHDGWTWGSMGGVFAETPDRIWVAMRGELPLPEGAEPWTAYGATNLVGQIPRGR